MRVLIVDDHPANLKLLRAVLESENCVVVDATDGVEALRALETGMVDAIISDILMPNLDGFALCQRVRAHPQFKTLPFIFYTSTYNSASDEKTAYLVGGDKYLIKPSPAAALIAALHEVTSEAKYRQPRAIKTNGETLVMREYNAALVRKLEEKNNELATTVESMRQVQQQLLLQGTALATAANAVVITDAKGIIQWVNAAFTTLTGYAADEALGQTPRLLKSGQHGREFYKKLWATILVGETWHGNFTNRRKDGSLYFDEHTITPVRARDGAVTHFVAIMNDVTERRRAELALRDAHAQLSHLVARSPTVIFFAELVGQEAQPYFVSENVQTLTGFTVAESVDLEWWRQHVLPDDRSEAETGLSQALQGGSSRVEYRMAHKDGRHIWVEDRKRWLPGADEGTGEIVGGWTDITARKQAEAVARETEERFRQVVENIREVFWMTDVAKNQMLYISPGYEKVWGRTSASLYASPQSWVESIYPEDRARVLDAAQTKQVRGDYDETYRIVRPDGAVRWVRDQAFPIKAESGVVTRVVGVAEDITEQRKLEEQFRQAQKMEAIGTLAGGIAHDFNNVLAAISGYTELTKMEVAGNAAAVEHLNAVLHGAGRAADLVRQILTFSRRQEIERRPIQLWDVVTEALKLLRATVPTPIEFEVSLGKNTANVFADPSQIHQIMMNLCTNAAHAMKESPGRLTVKLENFDVDADFATAHAGLRTGRHVLLSVSDTGCGMDETTLSRIFEPFFTTKAPGEGTGLGLAVVHGIMQSHDGLVTVYSHPGEGTTFRLYFPAHVGGRVETVIEPGLVPRGHGEHVLYVDDEAPLATMGKKILERLGYVVDARIKAVEALDALRANPAAFDLVVTDQMMPGMTGVSLAEQIKLIRPELPIILITGYTATLTTERVQAMGIRKLLLKPISVEALGTTVAHVLAEVKSR